MGENKFDLYYVGVVLGKRVFIQRRASPPRWASPLCEILLLLYKNFLRLYGKRSSPLGEILPLTTRDLA